MGIFFLYSIPQYFLLLLKYKKIYVSFYYNMAVNYTKIAKLRQASKEPGKFLGKWNRKTETDS